MKKIIKKTKSRSKVTKKKKLTKGANIKPKKYISPILLRARNLRSSLLRRISPELKYTTPTIDELFNWLNREVFICNYSSEELTLDEVTIDHKNPLTRGGLNSLDNLCFCSKSMNSIKGSLNDKEFKEILDVTSNWDKEVRESFFRRIKMGHFGK